ncbi:MAG: ABC transporter permease subunit [Candidatus Latescibacteria bacterium]|nr:ABC transporter permease subunit [bacterium]MBD3423641.1 ABC transporter permease subunit [Candidatus Latescibacterota bacterium]
MKIFKVAKREYLQRVRKKSFLIVTLLGPVLMAALTLAPVFLLRHTGEQQTGMTVIDMTGNIYTQFSEALSDTLDDGRPIFNLERLAVADSFEFERVKPSLNEQINSGIIDGYLYIPEDVVQEGGATFYGEKVGNIKTVGKIESELNNIIISKRLKEEGMEYSEVKDLFRKTDLKTVQIQKGEERESSFDIIYMTTFIFIMVLYFTILMWGIAVQRSIIEEKNNRVIEVLLSSLRPVDLLGGKILGVGSVGLTQYLIWGLAALLFSLYGISMGGSPAALQAFSLTTMVFFLVYYLLGFLFYATIFAGIGSICNSDQEAQQIQTPVVMCLVFTIIIPIVIIQNPDGAFATVISLIPLFTPTVMFMRINILMPPAWQIGLSILLMLAGIYIMGRLSAKIFRTGILMYGKRPDARELLKWLKRS